MTGLLEVIHRERSNLGIKTAVLNAWTPGAVPGESSLVPLVTGKKIKVLALMVSAIGAGSYELRDGAGGTRLLNGAISGTVQKGDEFSFLPVGWCETTAATALFFAQTVGTATTWNVTVVYAEVG